MFGYPPMFPDVTEEVVVEEKKSAEASKSTNADFCSFVLY